MCELFFKEKYAWLEQETPFSFSKRSSIGCGGVSSVAFYPKTVEEMLTLVRKLQADGVGFYTVGNLTNVLPSEGKIQKAVICTKKMQGAQTDGLFFPAGISSAKLLARCKELQKSGGEFLEGIPCTLGGALFMNAGVSGRYISEIVESVTVYRAGKVEVLPVDECGYAYKKSVFMKGDAVILGAKLLLKDSDTQTIENLRAEYKKKRSHLPKGKSMGCVFKNPEGKVAGKLIEGAGLKGLRVGGAKVSELHANFILNDKNATASDIRALIGIIKQAVFAQYRVRLEEEIQYLT